jgi:hypothetical protein
MKKKILYGLSVALIAVVATVNVQIAANNRGNVLDLTLENVESMACKGESPCGYTTSSVDDRNGIITATICGYATNAVGSVSGRYCNVKKLNNKCKFTSIER